MKEYDKIADVTKQFLTGRLYKLTMEFISKDNLRVSILYEDNYDEYIDYEFEVHPSSGETDFLGHSCHKSLYSFKLERNPRFEREISNMICPAV